MKKRKRGQNQTRILDYKTLPITNNFMFCKVMSNEALCKDFLEVMLKIKISKVKYINTEQQKSATEDSKSVRFDVYVEDGRRVFDIEMQMADTTELPKRARYYQSIIDIDCLNKGEHYKDLKESFIIFIMKKDIFHASLPCYTFENTCRENSNIKLNDKTLKIFYNISAYKNAADGNVRNILEYFETGRQTDKITGRMQFLLDKARKNSKWRKAYMTWALERNFMRMDAVEEGREIGIREGKRKGMREGIREGRREGMREGRQEGRREGEQAALFTIAKNMISNGLSTEMITNCTGLNTTQINELRKQQVTDNTKLTI